MAKKLFDLYGTKVAYPLPRCLTAVGGRLDTLPGNEALGVFSKFINNTENSTDISISSQQPNNGNVGDVMVLTNDKVKSAISIKFKSIVFKEIR